MTSHDPLPRTRSPWAAARVLGTAAHGGARRPGSCERPSSGGPRAGAGAVRRDTGGWKGC